MECLSDVYSNNTICDDIISYIQPYTLRYTTWEKPPREAWSYARRSRVYINWFTPVTREMVSDHGCLELVIARSSGYDHIDIEAAEENDLCVTNQPELIDEAVAEYAVAGILAALKQVIPRHMHTPKWESQGWPRQYFGFLIRGRRLGLLGAGRIGESIAHKLKALGIREIYYYARSTKPGLEAMGARRVSLKDLFQNSDILVNSLPLTRETIGMVGKEHLLSLPADAVYVNVGRGRTEEEDAVSQVATVRRDLFFVLDVHPEEPIPHDHRRLELAENPRVVLAPHMAGASEESRIGTTILALMQARDYLDHGCVWNPVTSNCKRCPWGPPSLDEIIMVARKYMGSF